MKKILLVLAGLMCSVAGVFAKADVTVKSGSLAELKGVKEKIYVVWDYSHATLEEIGRASCRERVSISGGGGAEQ